MAKNKLSTLGIVLLAVALLGVILAVVGIAVPWFATQSTNIISGDNTESYGLFAEYLESDFPIALVQTFAIISLVLAVAACAVLALNTLGVVKVKWLYRVVCAAVVILFAVLTFIFALVFANQYGSIDFGALGNASFVASAGSYLLPIGTLLTGVPLVFNKD